MLENKSTMYRYALVIAPLLLALIGMRFNISFLVWIAFVPMLVMLRETYTIREWFLVFMLLQLGFFLQIAKMYSNPIPFGFIPMFSVPAALWTFILLYLYEKIRRRCSGLSGIFIFAALMVVGEYINNSTSFAGTWGTLGYVLIESQPIMQLSSIFGISFVSYFIFLANAFIANFLLNESKYYKSALSTFLVFLVLYGYGVIRIDSDINSKHIKVAAVVSDLVLTPNNLPSKKELEHNTNTMLERTIKASEYGAKVIAWNEGATLVYKEDENLLVKRAKEIAEDKEIYLYIAYIVPIDGFKSFENKYLFIDKQGNVLDRYFKHFPVPGEGAVKGHEPLKVYNVEGLKLGGGICYDYDFMQMGKEHAENDVGLVVVPASDWKGIDDYHAKMAVVRAIEAGHSILRPVRGATSVAADGLGNIRASMSYFENNEKIMLASLPAKRIVTLYSLAGDLFYYIQILLLLVMVGKIFTSKEKS